ncbi:LemA family protein [Patescibacteria group bacterium]|nr:LemA family protein [Patescibacteria group bacterium]
MKKGLLACGIIAGVVVLIGIVIAVFFMGTYNTLVKSRENVDNKWAQVENQYQRRADLIPNLVNTVKGYASHEEDVFTEVTALRSQWGKAVDSGDREQQIEAANGMDSAISRLLLVAESYPELKANENFLQLQAQLEGTENRIAVERMRYNDEVTTYNKKIKVFPTNLIAGMFGFIVVEYFEAEEGSDVVPEVTFD